MNPPHAMNDQKTNETATPSQGALLASKRISDWMQACIERHICRVPEDHELAPLIDECMRSAPPSKEALSAANSILALLEKEFGSSTHLDEVVARKIDESTSAAQSRLEASELREAELAKALKRLEAELLKGNPAIADTVWMSDSPNETMLECIEHALSLTRPMPKTESAEALAVRLAQGTAEWFRYNVMGEGLMSVGATKALTDRILGAINRSRHATFQSPASQNNPKETKA